jgi:hypothetical protein
VDCDGVRVLRVGKHTIDAFNPHARGGGAQFMMPGDRIGPPDLRDPATLGCLLALVREVWGSAVWLQWWCNAAPTMDGKVRSVCAPFDGRGRRLLEYGRNFATKADAIVAAMEAAPTPVAAPVATDGGE